MLTAVEMEDTMAEIKAYCTSPLHNQFPEEETHPINLIPVPADLQDEEEVVTWVTSLKTSGQVFIMQLNIFYLLYLVYMYCKKQVK